MSETHTSAKRTRRNSRTQREIEEDRELTRALKDTFPASDPVSIGEPTGPEVAHGGGPARPGEPLKKAGQGRSATKAPERKTPALPPATRNAKHDAPAKRAASGKCADRRLRKDE